MIAISLVRVVGPSQFDHAMQDQEGPQKGDEWLVIKVKEEVSTTRQEEEGQPEANKAAAKRAMLRFLEVP